MSFKAVNWAWDQKGLTPHQKLVLLALANRHNPDVGCFPSLNKLVEDVEFSKSTVQRSIQKLQELGLIRVEHATRQNGSQTSNRYHLHFEGGSGETTTHSHSDYPPVSERLPHKQVKDKQVRDKQLILNKRNFECFYEKYPRRIGKIAAEKAWEKAIKKVDPNLLVVKAKIYANHVQASQIPMKFVPHPATWLNQGRWEDELAHVGDKTTTDILNGLFQTGPMGIEKQ